MFLSFTRDQVERPRTEHEKTAARLFQQYRRPATVIISTDEPGVHGFRVNLDRYQKGQPTDTLYHRLARPAHGPESFYVVPVPAPAPGETRHA